MKKVCTEHLIPGMVINRDIPGVDQSVFLTKGTILSIEDIQNIMDLGLSSVSIVSGDKEDDLKDLARRCEEYVRTFFYYVDPGSSFFNGLYVKSLNASMERLVKENSWVLPCEQELRAADHQSSRDLFFQGEGGPEDIVGHEMELISVPDTYLKLQEILKSPKSSAANVAEVVRLDVNLVAKLLRLVNSSIYSFPTKIESVERAVAIIGVEGVSSLALGITAIPMFKDIPPDLMDVPTFWNHSISCAIFSKSIAQAAGFEGEPFFTVGLLHDVGRLLLLKNLPQAYLQVLLYARGSFIPLMEAENVILGYNHAYLGEILLKKWGCPEKLVTLVGAHHCPDLMGVKEAVLLDLFERHGQALYEISRSLV
ncbi:MAG: HDOD domain-containing protein [Desulfovibrionales bacterium]|nr:HDOD domain-containing protein [Desulfovibrionales bacterium]